ncbi:MAG: flagellar basal-body rod protein FlgF [Rhodospirillaceae bacterium]|nr:MAG: flagellar basal-body rod protein FlgF [Rhodospirillaceae bacterium]
MENTAYIALSRQGVLRRELDTIAHNMANMNTTGFKSERMMFVEHLTKSKSGDFIADQRLAFVRDVASYSDFADGPIEQTGNPLDVAINGDGYFTVQAADGTTQYTRNGSFRMDNGGQLVNQSGLPVLTDAGTPIFFAPEDASITIAGDGTVSSENGQIGKLSVVTFDDPYGLKREASGLYSTDQLPIPKLDAQVSQGGLEGSNVSGILEMTRMIKVSRSYSSAQKLIDKEDERIRQAIRQLASATPT